MQSLIATALRHGDAESIETKGGANQWLIPHLSTTRSTLITGPCSNSLHRCVGHVVSSDTD